MPRPIQDYFFRRCIGSGEVPKKNAEDVPIVSKKRKRGSESPEKREKLVNESVISTGQAAREDELDIILDLDGWQHIIKDDEDLEFLRESLKDVPDAPPPPPPPPISGSLQEWAWEEKVIKEHYRGEVGISRTTTRSPVKPTMEGNCVPNKSGCARTEGYRKIPLSEKVKYLPQYAKARQSREEQQAKHALDNKNNNTAGSSSALQGERLVKQTQSGSQPSLISARAHRRNQRLFAKNMTAQLAILASGGDSDTATTTFNQLRKRMKRHRFLRSAIHGWGLFTEEKISANDMIIEYVGEIISRTVADKREQKYLKSGIGSCYMFKLDDEYIIDATEIGGVARLINHCCMPNADCRKVEVDGRTRLVLYASRDIGKGI